jgi:UDP-2,4-diacetamido-2,4,6-trideoxy-beta-L-altropyranose hydrolase
MRSKNNLPPLLLRADAGAATGTGHVMRSLALAQAWQARGGTAAFLSHCEARGLSERIEAAGIGSIPLEERHPAASDLETTIAMLSRLTAPFIALDGYHFDSEYQLRLREAGNRILVIDDNAHLGRYHADIILNQNLGASRLAYPRDSDTVLLLEPRYALLRTQFRAWSDWHRDIPRQANKVLVTLGGGDSDNVTLKVIEALRRPGRTGLETRIVAGPANPHIEILRHAAAALSSQAEILTSVSDMASLMAWADVAVTAGGSTSWELACMGLPSVTIVLAENQKRSVKELVAAGVTASAGWHEHVTVDDLAAKLGELLRDPLQRLRMSDHGRALVDGKGADRVVRALLERACQRAA